jgi:molybdenum cofactor cytidylyltransferase/nicotine blue oxidoreductase
VLAAGLGTRFGGPKAEVVLAGVRLVDRAVATLRDAGCSTVVAVVPIGVTVPQAVVVVNPRPESGMRSSLELGVSAAEAERPDGIVVLLADMPGVTASDVAAVVAAWRPGRVAIATYRGERGHPVMMSPSLWREAIASAGPDEGARNLLRANPRIVDEVAASGDPHDIDRPSDLG